LPESLSLALGTANVTLLQMAEAYAVFANGGYRINTYFFDRIVNTKNKIIYKTAPIVAGDPIAIDDHTKNIAPRVITPQNAYLITSALRDVIQHGTGRGALVLQRTDLAGKTGTTNDKRDAWFCGFNSNMVSIAWIGFDQQHSLYEYASKAALPLWVDFMAPSLKDKPYATMPQPNDITTVRIDSKSGLLAPPNDPNAIFEKFRTEDIPTEKDTDQAATAPGSADDTPANMNDLY
ncbi:MAG TPA: penicillin-binding transpeptidase domain-containing protein, partial [Gammaproteobacteria bacterium]|nr:penicillin-binding transpeptidase domain-containing protein [Gammaproteobacteria bacterium]